MIPTIYFLFPETKGRTLEEIASVFDGQAAETDAFRRASVGAPDRDEMRGGKVEVSDIAYTEKV
ncbi:hypothetical protein LTR29_017948 [Friedmanniomyces endolithicus]|nr:hypothetical protein LTR29_017948 [Friedmanniomyces endolithicus]